MSAPGIFLVEALRLGQLVGGRGDRQVARLLVVPGLDLGRRQIGEELGHALVVLGRVTLQHPKRGTADDRVLRRALDIRPVGQHADAELEVGDIGGDAGVARRALRIHRAFLIIELGRCLVGAAAIVEDLRLLPFAHLGDVVDHRGLVEDELGAEPAEAVGQRADRLVVPSREVLDVDPALPGRGEATRVAGFLQRQRCLLEFRPGRGRRLRVEPGSGERVLVVPEHGRRAVERHRQHQAFGRRVVAGHRLQVGARIERLAGVLHQLVDRIDGTLGTHHGGGADLEDLDDVRLLARPERGDRRRHRLCIGALEGRDDLVIVLGGVEVGGDLLDPLAVGTPHGVPPLDLCLGHGGAAGAHGGNRQNGGREVGLSHECPPSPCCPDNALAAFDHASMTNM